MRKKVNRNQKNQSKLKVVLLVALVIVLIGACFFAYKAYSTTQDDKTKTTDGRKVNLDPPTKEEKDTANDQKEINLEKESREQQQPTGQASVIITSATKTSIKGYVADVFEDGGTCTATATQDQKTITKTSEGFRNVSYTQCAPIEWGTPLSSGTWSISLSYDSPTSQGSQSKTLSVE